MINQKIIYRTVPISEINVSDRVQETFDIVEDISDYELIQKFMDYDLE